MKKAVRHNRRDLYLAQVRLLFESLQELRAVLLMEQVRMEGAGTLRQRLGPGAAQRLMRTRCTELQGNRT